MIRSPDCQHSEWISCFLCKIQRGARAACYLGQLQSIGTVSCVSLCCSLLKNTWWYCLRKTEAHPPWGCWCLDIIHVSFAVNAALIVYQESRTQSTVWGSVPLKRWARKSVPTVQWMPLSMVCILRGTKGINKSVLCVLPCCELPFNTFPRAALEKRHRGPEMENNILNRPSAHALFSVVRERTRARQRERETSMTFKIHRGEVLPSGPADRSAWGPYHAFSVDQLCRGSSECVISGITATELRQRGVFCHKQMHWKDFSLCTFQAYLDDKNSSVKAAPGKFTVLSIIGVILYRPSCTQRTQQTSTSISVTSAAPLEGEPSQTGCVLMWAVELHELVRMLLLWANALWCFLILSSVKAQPESVLTLVRR